MRLMNMVELNSCVQPQIPASDEFEGVLEEEEKEGRAGRRASSKKRPRILSNQERRPTRSRPESKGALLLSSPLCPYSCPAVFPAIWLAFTLESMAAVRDTQRQRSSTAMWPDSWLHCMKSALLSPVEDSGSPSCTYNGYDSKKDKIN